MKTLTLTTPNDIREAGIRVLMDKLGPANTIRFLQQFDPGHGDYTAERRKILGNPTLDELVREIKVFRRTNKKKSA